jgi:hypothetical protein
MTPVTTIAGIRAMVLAAALVMLGSTLHAAEPTTVTFFAYNHDSEGHIAGQNAVTCLALRSDGAIALGKTDQAGEITLPYSELFRPDTLAVLFCRSDGDPKCSAIRLDVPGLRGFAEYNVEVRTPEIVDRMKIGAPSSKPRG